MPRVSCSELVDRGDLAAVAGDSTALAKVLRLLAHRVGDPLAERCYVLARDLKPAMNDWKQLRTAIVDRIATAGS